VRSGANVAHASRHAPGKLLHRLVADGREERIAV
jgi:hypothetical protein